MERAFTDEELVDLRELAPIRELEVVEEVDDLLEGRVPGEVGDVVPDVPEPALEPVDVGDARLRRNDLAEALVGHETRIVGRSVTTKNDVPLAATLCAR